ncbi:phospholipase C accessory protein PlcR [Burkholderia oklahomensis]|uniref:phospholipase C accessory protein PlcR n=1 Tax=Burkholderia oklahomensis TaxID=342113 RepID=UPI000474390E|nr:phospholipase C accessory protein PlcR [Burkholderia oklahomensis]AJX34425.1 phospholipase C accessory protein PlcR [Burkholderia oklahomensis C6786]AOI49663.1 phospholipase C accessory protein PlcR [Burkholderia oklahomensis C6786]KUY55691.1 phospholipase C accessory protein PlcR [Burkholderia oklahomensis C6786]MBI0362045.1 phospholipase C accessory protein PlcR [Burkholderia oklahomensis]SUY28995.1 phospholipase C accessory protein PlcR [Burkholderia oklahomensis]
MKKPKARWLAVLLLVILAVTVASWRSVTLSQTASTRPMQSGAMASGQGEPPIGASTADALANAGPAERRLDLVALRKSLEGRENAEAEVQRIVAFARFRDRVAAYGSLRSSMPEAERAILASRILAELPEHVARNEIVPVQAEALSAALISDAAANSATRSAAIQAMRQQWDGYARRTVGVSPAQDARYPTYVRQSRDIIQQVQASVSDPEQQQAVIAQRLQALRVQLFDQASPTETH